MLKYIFGPVPSRRLGQSLGISPIPAKTCNYSCIYCQLGRTSHLINNRQSFFAVEEILDEFKLFESQDVSYDVVTIVGEGEPTLYLYIGTLIKELKKMTTKPIAVITNGALLKDAAVREALMHADIVLPSLDAWNEESFKKINRPFGSLRYRDVVQGLNIFSHEFGGQLWLEIMLMKGMNDGAEALQKLKEILMTIQYERLYINTPVRPPAEMNVQEPEIEVVLNATEYLGGISINTLAEGRFYSSIADDYDAVKSIIKRHPMNQHEVQHFLTIRNSENVKMIMEKLKTDPDIEMVFYKSYSTYRMKF